MRTVGIIFFVIAATALSAAAEPKYKVPAVYVFGDSTADVGNNNYLPGNDAKANFPHYGVDFPHQTPTGRFSNGYNGIDFLSIHMGFKRSPPPYLSIANKTHSLILKGLRGVNFASGGSGILDTTGSTVTMAKQVQDFAALKSIVASRLSLDKANYLLRKSVFLISSGGNDLIGFFSATNSSPTAAQVGEFYNAVAANYSNHLKTLYGLGARKFALIDVPAVGCCPFARSNHPAGACIDGLNDLAKGLNDRISLALSNLTSELPGMKHTIGSSYNVVMKIVADPLIIGYKDVKSACCGGGKLGAESSCSPSTAFCVNRNEFLFWDRIHPTQATSEFAGLAFYSGSLEFASPINLKQLVEDA
ncbi:GDSL esterase/lipase [Canna indica]|uniref:GDSL esterase/lipase n=1 Tax=Canna indica TaxID=4628 RepID=A0AAQ3L6N9_9LILI|nr:GDSL esterase/lipase [Canna indica]